MGVGIYMAFVALDCSSLKKSAIKELNLYYQKVKRKGNQKKKKGHEICYYHD